jgi:prefoldin subunit 5
MSDHLTSVGKTTPIIRAKEIKLKNLEANLDYFDGLIAEIQIEVDSIHRSRARAEAVIRRLRRELRGKDA